MSQSPAPKTAPERIAKLIARAGISSRREAEALIAAGRVTLSGVRVESPAITVLPGADIRIDGKPLPPPDRTRLWLYHKPRGLVTTTRDPDGRPTIFEKMPPELPRVISIGRLDINTEGLLLLTNDGGVARVLALPATGWLRRYRVRAHGTATAADLARLAGGISVDGVDYGPVEAELDRVQGSNLWLTVGLREGRNREVKAVLGSLGLSVTRLIRISFGPFQLGDLVAGAVREGPARTLRELLGARLAEEAGADLAPRPEQPPQPRSRRSAGGQPGQKKPSPRPPRPARGDQQRTDGPQRPPKKRGRKPSASESVAATPTRRDGKGTESASTRTRSAESVNGQGPRRHARRRR